MYPNDYCVYENIGSLKFRSVALKRGKIAALFTVAAPPPHTLTHIHTYTGYRTTENSDGTYTTECKEHSLRKVVQLEKTES